MGGAVEAVSIRAPARGATIAESDALDARRGFNPRPRAGGDPLRMPAAKSRVRLFQSAPPRGGRRPRRRLDALLRVVSIRAPARGATPSPCTAGARYQFQSAPPRGGRLGSRVRVRAAHVVFQSAPPRGGRRHQRRKLADGRVSIRAPARGATWTTKPARLQRIRGFQSAPPRGGRLDHPEIAAACGDVSIRAPARGATRAGATRRPRPGFNPRPRAGGDSASESITQLRGFNPRPRAGGDRRVTSPPAHSPHVSIRAPARGATRRRRGGPRPAAAVSIRAPARGATRCPCRTSAPSCRSCFNPRPRAGGDTSMPPGYPASPQKFQSAPPRGGRRMDVLDWVKR